MIRRFNFFSLLLFFFLLQYFQTSAQFDHTGRGMYVNRFFRVAVNSSGAFIPDPNYSILSITSKEDSLLKYAKENHITYLILYDLYYVFGNDEYENYLCDFIEKAKSEYCIEKIGVASSCAGLFDNVSLTAGTEPENFSSEKFSGISKEAFRDTLQFTSQRFAPGDSLFLIAEAAKLGLRTSSFNDNCLGKLDVLVTEYEFWSSAADDCIGDSPNKDIRYQRFQSLINYMDIIRDDYNVSSPNHKLYIESYIGYLNQNTIYSHQNIADWMDGSYNGIRRIDRINPHYYGTDASRLYSRTSAGHNTNGYYATRFLDFCQPSTVSQTNIHPIFSSESIFWGAGSNYLSTWFNQNTANNIFTAEKFFYNDWYADATVHSPSVVGNVVSGNVIDPGGVVWFTSNQMNGHLEKPLLFSSNSPVCVAPGQSGSLQFNYQGPIEEGISYKFYLTDQGNTNLRCGTMNSLTWPAYNGATQSSIDLNAALGGCTLPEGVYDAHLELTFAPSCFVYYVPVMKVSVVSSGKIVALSPTTTCQGNPVYLQASSTGNGTSTYAWYEGSNLISGATSQSYAVNPAFTGIHNISCKITSSLPGCSANRTTAIPVTINVNPVASISVQSSANCSSVLRASPSGGSYYWSNGSTTQLATANNSGNYSVTVTQNGCSSVARYTYQNVSIQKINQTNCCYGSNNGTLTVNIYYGIGPYTISWNGPSVGSLPLRPAGHHIIQNLPAGIYTITVTDSRGCSRMLFPSVEIFSYPPIIINTETNASTCILNSDGEASVVSVTGGDDGPYSFYWPIINSTNYFITNLSVGSYNVIVTDGALCTASKTVTIPALQSSVNPVLNIIPDSSPIICLGSSATYSASGINGGTQPVYEWKVNGIFSGNNDSIFISDQLQNGDVLSCTMTSNAECLLNNQTTVSSTVLAESCPVSLTVQIFIEGFYTGGGQMRAVSDPLNSPFVTDTVIIKICDVTSGNVFHEAPALLQTNGLCQFTFIPPRIGSLYFIAIKHRNSLETWSKFPFAFNTATNFYSFIDGATKAFSDNQKDLGDGNFAIPSGDIDQNGMIEMADFELLQSYSQLFSTGYIREDLNGDHIVESSDFSLLENNLFLNVSRP